MNDNKKNLDLSTITDVAKDFNQAAISRDFSIKMREGLISCYQDYYEYANKESVDFSLKVAANRAVLRAIVESENAKKKELPPLKSMMETLTEYMEATDTQKL